MIKILENARKVKLLFWQFTSRTQLHGCYQNKWLLLIKFKSCSFDVWFVLMFKNKKNVLAKFNVECAFKQLNAVENNSTRKTRTTRKISTFFEDLSFLSPRGWNPPTISAKNSLSDTYRRSKWEKIDNDTDNKGTLDWLRCIQKSNKHLGRKSFRNWQRLKSANVSARNYTAVV